MGITQKLKQRFRQWLNGGDTDQIKVSGEQLSDGYAIWRRILGENLNTSSGQHVSPESALRVSAVMACVKVIAETLASVPLPVYTKRPDGGRERADTMGVWDTLNGMPNVWQTSFEFREMMTAHCMLRGNAYAEIIPGPRGAADQLIPLHPDRMKVERLENGRLRYTFTRPDQRERIFTQDEILHIRGLSSDGITGINPIQHAREPIALAMATEQHGSAFFGNGARPGVILETDQKLSPTAAERMREDWERLHRGSDNAHRTAVLEQGMKAHELGVSHEDAQFLETRRYQVADIARIFRVPLHLIGDLEHATFSNIEHQSLEFVKYTMLPWFRRWESAINRDLIGLDDAYAEFNIDGLLRGDSAARGEFYRTMLTNGLMSVNEIRKLENLNPVGAWGDRHFMQSNMATVDSIVAAAGADERIAKLEAAIEAQRNGHHRNGNGRIPAHN